MPFKISLNISVYFKNAFNGKIMHANILNTNCHGLFGRLQICKL